MLYLRICDCRTQNACLCAVIVGVDAAAQTADEIEPVQPRVNGLHRGRGRWGRMEEMHIGIVKIE